MCADFHISHHLFVRPEITAELFTPNYADAARGSRTTLLKMHQSDFWSVHFEISLLTFYICRNTACLIIFYTQKLKLAPYREFVPFGPSRLYYLCTVHKRGPLVSETGEWGTCGDFSRGHKCFFVARNKPTIAVSGATTCVGPSRMRPEKTRCKNSPSAWASIRVASILLCFFKGCDLGQLRTRIIFKNS